MSLFENFPYTNFHELNLDWIIKTVKELNEKFDEAISAKIKFADPIQWDITKPYETLTIVMDNDNAYLSMQPVPPGTLLTNPDYWQQIFDMSTLYQMVEDLEQSLSDDIQELANDTEAAINALDATTIKNNSTKHILWVGDSYSTWNNGGLYNTFVLRSGVPSENCHNLAVSGSGFVSDGVSLFINQVQSYTGDRDEITDIIVCGGINDAKAEYVSSSTAQGLFTAISDFIDYCKANYPNATVHTAYVGGTLPTSTYYTTLHPKIAQEWALFCYTVAAGGYGYHVLETWNAIHVSPDNYSSDGLHPNSTGSQAIGEAVARAFNNNPIIYSRPQQIYSLTNIGVNSTPIEYFSYITNNHATISIPDKYILITNGESIGQDQWYPIFEMGKFKMRPPRYYNAMAQIMGFNGNMTPKQVPFEMKIEDGVISIKVYSLNGSSYETLTAGNFSAITFFGFPNFECPVWQMN